MAKRRGNEVEESYKKALVRLISALTDPKVHHTLRAEAFLEAVTNAGLLLNDQGAAWFYKDQKAQDAFISLASQVMVETMEQRQAPGIEVTLLDPDGEERGSVVVSRADTVYEPARLLSPEQLVTMRGSDVPS